MIRVIVVDDEPLAREGVSLRLAKEADVQVVAECGNGRDAIEQIAALKPDLVFLDIKMPQITGFDVIRAVGAEHMPPVIFLTAYDDFAIEAFRVHAVDYLLKPINNKLFAESLSRVRQQIQKSRVAVHSQQLSKLLEDMQAVAPDAEPECLVIRSAGHVHFLRPREIQWVAAEGDYIKIHTESRSHLVRDTMRNMEQRLQEHGFQRVHRSAIINLELVEELLASDSGDYEVVIKGGTRLKVGRSFRDALFESLETRP